WLDSGRSGGHLRRDLNLVRDRLVDVHARLRRPDTHDERVPRRLLPAPKLMPLPPPADHRVDSDALAAREIRGGTLPAVVMQGSLLAQGPAEQPPLVAGIDLLVAVARRLVDALPEVIRL